MSSYLMHNAFSLNFPDAAQYICLQLLEAVVLTLKLPSFPKILVKHGLHHVMPSQQQFLSINPSF